MKSFFMLSVFILYGAIAYTQTIIDTTYEIYPKNQNTKETEYLLENEKVAGTIIKWTPGSLTISKTNKSDSFITATFQTIPVAKINTIKVKRKGMLVGLVSGIVVGAIGGYALGSGDCDDESRSTWAGIKTGAIGAVALAIPGAIIGGIFTKHIFKINGRKEKFQRMTEKL
jgi:hypothetical protein